MTLKICKTELRTMLQLKKEEFFKEALVGIKLGVQKIGARVLLISKVLTDVLRKNTPLEN